MPPEDLRARVRCKIELCADTFHFAISQVRFELGYYALKPEVKVIAPWREWDLNSRTKLLAYADANGIDVPNSKRGGEPPFSTDANLLHISYEVSEGRLGNTSRVRSAVLGRACMTACAVGLRN